MNVKEPSTNLRYQRTDVQVFQDTLFHAFDELKSWFDRVWICPYHFWELSESMRHKRALICFSTKCGEYNVAYRWRVLRIRLAPRSFSAF